MIRIQSIGQANSILIHPEHIGYINLTTDFRRLAINSK